MLGSGVGGGEQRGVEVAPEDALHALEPDGFGDVDGGRDARVVREFRREFLRLEVVDAVLEIDGDLDLRHHAGAERLNRIAHVEKRAEQDDSNRDRTDRGELHPRVAGKIRQYFTKEEPAVCPSPSVHLDSAVHTLAMCLR